MIMIIHPDDHDQEGDREDEGDPPYGILPPGG